MMRPWLRQLGGRFLSTMAPPVGSAKGFDLFKSAQQNGRILSLTPVAGEPAPKKSVEPMVRERKVDKHGRAYGTGKRKCAIARVWIFPGTGIITVNSLPFLEYFNRLNHTEDIVSPFFVAQVSCEFDVKCLVHGGGKSGQAGAMRLGIARALQNWNPDFRPALKAYKFLTRDSRIVESKKPGRKKARKLKQWTKR